MVGNPLNFNLEDVYGDVYVDILDGKFIRGARFGTTDRLFNLQSLLRD